MPFKAVDISVGERVGIVGSGIVRTNASRIVYIARDTTLGVIELVTESSGSVSGERSFIYSLPPGELLVPVGATYQVAQLGDAGDFRWEEITEGQAPLYTASFVEGSFAAGAAGLVSLPAVAGQRFYMTAVRFQARGGAPAVESVWQLRKQPGGTIIMRVSVPPTVDAQNLVYLPLTPPIQCGLTQDPTVDVQGINVPAIGAGTIRVGFQGYFR